ncbi:hypothetical protein CHU98_g7474, partial [Xylaria longipes]
MSSTTGLSRTRSIRRPAANNSEPAQTKPVHGRNGSRTVSPSRLPMRPPTTTTTTTTTTSRTRAPTGLTSRQASGGSSTKTSTRSAGNANGAPAAVKPLGRVQSVRQAPSTTTTSATTIGRSASTVARPRSSEGVASAKASRERHMGHSRAKSTVTSLTTATTLRPLSHTPSRSNPSPAPSTASSTSTTTQTTSVSSSRMQTRSQTQHARVPSQSQTQHARVPSQSQPQSHTLAAARRPVFSTNQQHYSPAKTLAPKPLTSTFLAPPSPSKQPVNVALTAETSRLQTELLQLSLLHREAPGVSA